MAFFDVFFAISPSLFHLYAFKSFSLSKRTSAPASFPCYDIQSRSVPTRLHRGEKAEETDLIGDWMGQMSPQMAGFGLFDA